MLTTSSFRPLWARFATWLGCLAVFSALLVPVSMLAQDVRTGKLGGLCSLSAAGSGSTAGDASDSDGFSPAASHCDMCGSTGLGSPLQRQADGFPAAITAGVAVFEDAVRLASSPGLPFSRGPPAA